MKKITAIQRWGIASLIVAAAISLVAAAAPAQVQVAVDLNEMIENAGDSESLPVVVQMQAGSRLPAAIDGAEITLRGERVGAVAAALTPEMIEQLSHLPGVLSIAPDRIVRANLDVARAARANPEAAPIEDKERPLLRLALKAVNAPEDVGEADLDPARAQGWSDRDIFDAVVQAANNRAFNFVLRTFKVEHQGAFA